MSRALEFKEQGNRYFQTGDYVAAESLYTKAYEIPPPQLVTSTVEN
jgi:hypothetical protein